MHIRQIDAYQIDLPYAGGTYELSRGRSYTAFDATIVKITTDDGTSGWGESTPFGATYVAAHAGGVRSGLAELAPVLLGKDPRQVDRINDLMDETLVGHNHAKAALDIACWDVFGKVLGLPVAELLGGSVATAMPMISSIHAGEPQEMRQRVSEHRARGYRGHSVKIGALDDEGGPSLDAQRIIASMADQQPGEYFIVDANGGLSPEAVLRTLQLLPPEMDFVLEAPCQTWTETESVRRKCNYPLVLDELVQDTDDVIRLIRHDVADGIGLKISPAGGLTKARRQRDICQAAGLTMSVQDTVGSEVSFAAIVQLAATISPRLLRCVLNTTDMVTLKTAEIAVTSSDAGILTTQTPGLGLSVNEELLGEPVGSWS
ncbi:MAG TPA: hypothetical protein H9884_10555 [Candidatus Yaniella excrementigallinarum]|nr:hypothetical protein [Candidatus Yaniella excrementigallinarum]